MMDSMSNENVLVSVVIPTYGRPDSLLRAIQSVLLQSYKNFEVIVVDDNDPGSRDRSATEKLMLTFAERENVIYLKNKKNSERSYSRNVGANYAHGSYLMFLDNDDEFFEDKIKTQLSVLQSKNDLYAMSYSAYIRVADNGKMVCRSGENREGHLLVEALSRNLFIHPGSNLMIKRQAFEEVGGFNEKISYNEDIDLLIRLNKKYLIAYADTVGLAVHVRKKWNSVDLREITDAFTFIEKDIIDSLDQEEKKKVKQMHGLQLMRFYFMRNFKKCLEIKQNYNIGMGLTLRYCFYLGKRMISRKAYGFKI